MIFLVLFVLSLIFGIAAAVVRVGILIARRRLHWLVVIITEPTNTP